MKAKEGSPVNTAALLVAAGLSSRMGAFKPLLPLGTSTVIGTAVATLRAAGAAPIVAVTGREAENLEAYLAPLGVECARNDAFAETDMFCSAVIGFRRLLGRADRVFFLPADVPLFSADTLRALSACMDRTGCGVVKPRCAGRAGHPILLDAALLPALLAFAGGGGLRRAIESTGCRAETLELSDAGMTLDADRPEDYERLCAFVRTQEQKQRGENG